MGGYEDNPILLDKVRSCLFTCSLSIYLMMGSQDSSVSVVTGLWDGFVWGSIPGKGNRFFCLQIVQTSSGAHPASYSVNMGVFLLEVKQLRHEGEL
jgi:hypothetical protein